MKTFDYKPDELNQVVYELKEAESKWQEAKDTYEILYDTSKDLLSALVTNATSTTISKAEHEARATQDWKDFKQGLYQAQRTLGKLSIEYHHKQRVFDALISGMAFQRELIKRGVVDQ